MNLRPYERIVIISKLTVAEAELKLRETIAPGLKFNVFPFNTSIHDDYLFNGYVDQNRFVIELYFGSTIGPEIKGEIVGHEQGSELRIRMHPTLRSIPLYVMILIIAAFFVIAALSDKSNIGLAIVFPLICYSVIVIIMRKGIANVKRKLNGIFEFS